MKSAPTITITQKTAPFRNAHAGVQKLKLIPPAIQPCDIDNHAIIIGTITRIKPSRSSDHLFIVCCDMVGL